MIIYTSDDITEQLNDELKKINSAAKRMLDLVHTSSLISKKREAQKRLQNPYIVKSVIKNMAKGLNMTDAALLTAKEFETTCERVVSIVWEQKRYYSAIRLFARRYLCEKLKESGLRTKEIAKIAGVSCNHVYKMLRVKPDFWFLEHKPIAVDYPQYF